MSQRLDALTEIEAWRSWLAAQEARLLSAMDVGPGEVTDDKQWVRDEVAVALRWSPMTVNARMHEAQQLVHPVARRSRDARPG